MRAHPPLRRLGWAFVLLGPLLAAGCGGEVQPEALTEPAGAEVAVGEAESVDGEQAVEAGELPEALQAVALPAAEDAVPAPAALPAPDLLGEIFGPRISRLLLPRFDDPLQRRRGVVRVLVSHDRTNFFLHLGKLKGFEYELMRQFESFLREREGAPRTDLVYIALPFDRLIPELLAGRGDVIAANLTVTPERAEQVEFTRAYRRDVNEIVVRWHGAPRVARPEDLSGRKVHVLPGTSHVAHLEQLNQRLQAEGRDPVTIEQADANLRSGDVLELVHDGVYAYTVADDHLAELWARVLDQIVLEPEAVLHRGGSLAWAVRRDNLQLLAALNEFVARHRQGTLVGNVLFHRYYGSTRWVKNPLDTRSRRQLVEIQELLQKYARDYDFDWLRLAALAYQESGFDPEARSSAGAVGIMQIRPSTAAEMGIADVEQDLEQNIHAGVRYLAFLRSRYFSDAEIPEPARFDFVAAAYNAGPARIQSLRRRAEAAGFDPNRWFFNVELVAPQVIGSETVELVSNVNKYYIALKSLPLGQAPVQTLVPTTSAQ